MVGLDPDGGRQSKAPRASWSRGQAWRSLRLDLRQDAIRLFRRAGQRFSRHRAAWRLLGTGLALLAGVVLGGLGARAYYRRQGARPVVAVNGIGYPRDQLNYDMGVVAGQALVRRFVDRQLRLQFASKTGTLPSDAAIDERLASERARPNFALRMASANLTQTELRETVRLDLAEFAYITRGRTVSEADVRAFYDADIARPGVESRFRVPVTAIVAAIETRSSAEAVASLDEIRAGDIFDEVARRRSIDVTARTGGLQPPLVRGRFRERYGKGVEQLVFGTMRPGQILGPLQLGATWWLLQLREIQPPYVVPYGEARAEARACVLLAKAGPASVRRYHEDLGRFAKSSRVQSFGPAYAGLAEGE